MDQLMNLDQLNFILRLGRDEETVTILGTRFTFRTLTVEESTSAFDIPSKEKYDDEYAKLNSFRIEVLSKALIKINDLVIPNNMREKIKNLLKGSQQVLLLKLFDAYQELMDRQNKRFASADANIEQQVPHASVSIPQNITSPFGQPEPKPEVKAPAPPPPPVEAPVWETTGDVDIVDPSELMGPKK